MFVFSETSCEGAEVVAERIRSTIANKPFVCGDISLNLSITIGFSYTHGDRSLQEIIKEADLALYRGKHSGKNRVVCYQDVCNDTM